MKEELKLTSSYLFSFVRYRNHIDKQVSRQPKLADLGGVPSITNKIKGYVRVLHLKDNAWTGDVEVRLPSSVSFLERSFLAKTRLALLARQLRC